jgi:hypothetical protein
LAAFSSSPIERAGHANVNITLSVYAAYMPSMQADAALRVDAWLR